MDLKNKIKEKVTEMTDGPEHRDRILGIMDAMSKVPPPMMGTQVNMFELTVALCTAAFCVGKDPNTVRVGQVRPTAIMLAKNLFTEDGQFIP
jgi:hypothetical protein